MSQTESVMRDFKFNKLTPAQAERLALLAEECGEVVQVVGKILRHGYESFHPHGGPNNRDLLTRELGDLRAAMAIMFRNGDVNSLDVADKRSDKLRNVGRYLHHHDAAGLQGKET